MDAIALLCATPYSHPWSQTFNSSLKGPFVCQQDYMKDEGETEKGSTPLKRASMRSVFAAKPLRSERLVTSIESAVSIRWKAKPTCGCRVLDGLMLTIRRIQSPA